MNKDKKENYALFLNKGKGNPSTLLLAYKELPGSSLKVDDYELNYKKPAYIYKLFVYIGEITIVFFSISILILTIAILIFKRWSNERFNYGDKDA